MKGKSIFSSAPRISKPKEPEHHLQVQCVRWFRMQHPKLTKVLFAVPNGGWRNAAVGAKLKAEGVMAGVSDLLLLVARGGHHGLCIEMKAGKGTQQPSQKEWQAQVEQQGYQYVVCNSIEGFMATVNDYLTNTTE